MDRAPPAVEPLGIHQAASRRAETATTPQTVIARCGRQTSRRDETIA